MEPQIQYAKTSDGVSIAYYTIGEGAPPLVYLAEPFLSHVQLEWQAPEMRSWYERLADKRMIVRYDGRGVGLSDREVSSHSLEASVLDVEAVVSQLGLESCAPFRARGRRTGSHRLRRQASRAGVAPNPME